MKKILIIGSGSISKKHYSTIKNLSNGIEVEIMSSRKFDKLNHIKFEKFIKLKPDLIIICSPATSHLRNLKKIEKNFKNIKVLIEKPIFEKNYKIKKRLKNEYYVGYNLRFHPVIIFLKKFLRGKKIFSINIISHSYLPDWREIDYRNSVSAKKKLGGGVLLELSHELDYVHWMFNKIKILYSYNNRISTLKIETDDILNIVAEVGKDVLLNLSINFFSQIPTRTIKIDGDKFSLNGDLIKNKIVIIEKKKKNIINFSNFKIKDTYKLQFLDILKNKPLNISTLNQSVNLMKILDSIKKYK